MTLLIGLLISFVLMISIGLVCGGYGLVATFGEKVPQVGIPLMVVSASLVFCATQSLRAFDVVAGVSKWEIVSSDDGTKAWRLVDVKKEAK